MESCGLVPVLASTAAQTRSVNRPVGVMKLSAFDETSRVAVVPGLSIPAICWRSQASRLAAE